VCVCVCVCVAALATSLITSLHVLLCLTRICECARNSGIKALADYVHSKGLKFGLYSDAGHEVCVCVTERERERERDTKGVCVIKIPRISFICVLC